MGSSRATIRSFPMPAKQDAGHQLDRVQRGLDPTDWKPMQSIGRGVREIRIRHEGQYRVIYIASLDDRIYVLHAFMEGVQEAILRVAQRAMYDDPRVAGGPDVLSESAR